MKKLFVVRHAKSSWDFPDLDDHDRPLNQRGMKDAPKMGTRIAKKIVKIDLMITSTAKRAADTATIIADHLSFSKSHIIEEPLFYHASFRELLVNLQTIESNVMTLMIFGHNPGLTDFVNHLTGSDIYNIPTCGIAEITFDVTSWQQVRKGMGRLISLDYPKKAI